MFIEGKCFANEFPVKIKEAVMSLDDSMATPQPFWNMVSSNVGETTSDDGYVFHSRGKDGDLDLFWGIKSEVNGFDYSKHQWNYGYRIFACSDYTPSGTSGTNGEFKDYIYEGTPFLLEESWSGYQAHNCPIKYWISVNHDRVIIAYKCEVRHDYARTNVIYVGRPQVTFNPNDRGMLFGSALGYRHNSHGSHRAIGYENSNIGTETMHSRSDIPHVNKSWGGKLLPATIFSYTNHGGHRGILDMLILKQDGTIRSIDNIKVGTTEYLGLEIPYRQNMDGTWYHNNFTNQSWTTVLLIPKV